MDPDQLASRSAPGFLKESIEFLEKLCCVNVLNIMWNIVNSVVPRLVFGNFHYIHENNLRRELAHFSAKIS